jgi:hypothetical protein
MILRPVRPASPCGPLLEHGSDDGRGDLVAQLRGADALGVLGREHDGLDRAGRLPLVAHRHLGLAVGGEVVELAGSAHRREPLCQAVREPDRQRHELGSLAHGVAEHDALIARALGVVDVGARPLALLERGIDALGDVRRLPADRDRDAARAPIEPDVARGVADVGDALTHDARDVDVARGGDLAGDVHETRGDERLDGDARMRIDREQSVEDRVGDLVADLVGVPLGDGLGGEEAQR